VELLGSYLSRGHGGRPRPVLLCPGPVLLSAHVMRAVALAANLLECAERCERYDSQRGPDSHLLWRPVVGGPEVQLRRYARDIQRRDRIGGLISEYYRAAA
jgi:hypothetical protein